MPGGGLDRLFRLGDILREYRGDSHNAAWVAAGLDAVEITLLTELWWGLPLNAYAPTRGFTDEQRADAVARLQDRGLLDGEAITDAGRAAREAIEAATDRGDEAVLAALGDDLDELLDLTRPWATAVVEAKGYPVDPSSLATIARR